MKSFTALRPASSRPRLSLTRVTMNKCVESALAPLMRSASSPLSSSTTAAVTAPTAGWSTFAHYGLSEQRRHMSSTSSRLNSGGNAILDGEAKGIVTAAKQKMEKLGALEAVQRLAEAPLPTRCTDVPMTVYGKPVSLAMVFMSLPKECRQLLQNSKALVQNSSKALGANELQQRLLASFIAEVGEAGRKSFLGASAESAYAYLKVETKTHQQRQEEEEASLTSSQIEETPLAELVVRWAIVRKNVQHQQPQRGTTSSTQPTSSKSAATSAVPSSPLPSTSATAAGTLVDHHPDVYLASKLIKSGKFASFVSPKQMYLALAFLIPAYPVPAADIAAIYARAMSTAVNVDVKNPLYAAVQQRIAQEEAGKVEAVAPKPLVIKGGRAPARSAAAAALADELPDVSELVKTKLPDVQDYIDKTAREMPAQERAKTKPMLRMSVSMKLVVKHYGRFVDVLRLLEPYGIFVSDNGLKATRATNEATEVLTADPSVTSSPFPAQAPSASYVALRDVLNPHVNPDEILVKARYEQKALISAAPSGWELEDISRIYQVECLPGDGRPPPQPELSGNFVASSTSRTSKNLIRDGGNEYTGVFTPQMLVPIIPTYFVPIELVVDQLAEGYTVEHIESIFLPTGTIEAITLMGQRFIRMHGGNRSVDLMRRGKFGNSFTANETIEAYHPYKPEVRFAEHILASMKRVGLRPWQWVSLRSVLTEMTDPAVVAQMPFQRYQSLVYFSQFQHMFGFSTNGEGELCYIGDTANANLTSDKSPIPSVVNELQGMLSVHSSLAVETIVSNASDGDFSEMFDDVDLSSIGGTGSDALDILNSMNGLTPYSRDLLLKYYNGDLCAFFKSHKEIFSLDEETNQVMLTASKRVKVDKKRSLEDRLNDANASRDRKEARKIRRQMARARNPDNPLFEPQLFAEELARFLPRNRHIALRAFMKNLPPELYDLFPKEHLNPFRNHPHLFKLFEYKQPGKLYVCRPEVPLPEGHLRQKYTEAEIIQLTASVLQANGGRPISIFSVFGKLPFFAREHVRIVNKGLFELLKNYPQYFLIVFRESVRMDPRSAFVSLVGMPPVVMDDSPLFEGSNSSPQRRGGGGGGGSFADDDASDPLMAEALAEVRDSVRKAGYTDKAEGGASDFIDLEDDL